MPPNDDFSLLDGSTSYKNLTLKFHKYCLMEGAEGGGMQEARCLWGPPGSHFPLLAAESASGRSVGTLEPEVAAEFLPLTRSLPLG